MDGYLKKNLAIYRHFAEKQDEDFVLLVDGKVGHGKSTIAMQIAKELDPSFCIDDICFTPEQWHQRIQYFIKNKIHHKCLVFDEAMEGLSARSFASFVNRQMIRTLTKIRYLNMYHILVAYSIFDMDKPIGIHRSHALVHVYKDGINKGRFTFFNEKKKVFLYLMGKKIYSYSRPQANFHGSFTRTIPLDNDAYQKKKSDSIDLMDNKKPAITPQAIRRYKNDRRLLYDGLTFLKKQKLSHPKIAQIFNTNTKMIQTQLDRANNGEYPKDIGPDMDFTDDYNIRTIVTTESNENIIQTDEKKPSLKPSSNIDVED